MTIFNAFHPFAVSNALPKPQRTIIDRCDRGIVNRYIHGAPEITAPLASVAAAVESAYILTAKDELPKVAGAHATTTKRQFYFAGDPFVPYSTDLNHTSGQARRTAEKWLAIAQHLEREEKSKAYEEAKAKAVAETAAKAAEESRKRRLDELADEWFGADYFTDLGPNKAAAVKEILRLETRLNEQDAA